MTPQETARAMLGWYDGNPSRWTQGVLFRDARGEPLLKLPKEGSAPPEAVCGCMMGVLRAVCPEGLDRVAFIKSLAEVIGTEWSAAWQDDETRTFADVVAVLELVAEGA